MSKVILTQENPAVTNFSKPLPKWVLEAIETHLLIEQSDAKSAGALGFMSRSLVLASLPYKDPKNDVFHRKNGDFSLRIVAGYEGGIPYGIYPRLLMSWLVTEIVTTKQPTIELGDSLKDFLVNIMGIKTSTGGKNGSGTRVTEQMKRLFGSLITAQYNGNNQRRGFILKGVQIASEVVMYDDEMDSLFALQASDKGWMDSKELAQLEKTELEIIEAENLSNTLWIPTETEKVKWDSHVVLNSNFFEECLNNPIPIDLRAYNALRGSPMAMDIYTWLTHRMYSLKKPSYNIPWEALMWQFGTQFVVNKNDPTGHIREFRRNFVKGLKMVKVIYPKVRVDESEKGLVLYPSPTHISSQQTSLF